VEGELPERVAVGVEAAHAVPAPARAPRRGRRPRRGRGAAGEPGSVPAWGSSDGTVKRCPATLYHGVAPEWSSRIGSLSEGRPPVGASPTGLQQPVVALLAVVEVRVRHRVVGGRPGPARGLPGADELRRPVLGDNEGGAVNLDSQRR
jgi:hypothetical protein